MNAVETTQTPFEALKQQLQEKKNAIPQQKAAEVHVREPSTDSKEVGGRSQGEERTSHSEEEKAAAKKIKFNKGEQFWDLDEDAVLEFMADKKPVKMTLKEMRDAAAGGVAVRNRLREVAEEKKKIGTVFKNISDTAKTDPIKALQLMMSKVNEIDPEMTYANFMNKFAEQARKLANMDPKEHKVWELERELQDKDKAIRSNQLIEMREDLERRTGMDAETFDELAVFIVEDPDLSKDIKKEEDIIEKVEELYSGITLHKFSHEILQEVDESISPRSPIVSELSKFVRLNPDFTEKDWLEVAREAVKFGKKDGAQRYLSNKQRTSTSEKDFIEAGLTPIEVLKRQALEKKRLKKAS
jgi:hypothetical protein